MQMALSIYATSMSWTMLGWLSRLWTSYSLRMCLRQSALLPLPARRCSTSLNLTATGTWVYRSWARQTQLNPPFPINLSGWYLLCRSGQFSLARQDCSSSRLTLPSSSNSLSSSLCFSTSSSALLTSFLMKVSCILDNYWPSIMRLLSVKNWFRLWILLDLSVISVYSCWESARSIQAVFFSYLMIAVLMADSIAWCWAFWEVLLIIAPSFFWARRLSFREGYETGGGMELEVGRGGCSRRAKQWVIDLLWCFLLRLEWPCLRWEADCSGQSLSDLVMPNKRLLQQNRISNDEWFYIFQNQWCNGIEMVQSIEWQYYRYNILW